jgi:hypothetical protein
MTQIFLIKSNSICVVNVVIVAASNWDIYWRNSVIREKKNIFAKILIKTLFMINMSYEIMRY